MRDQKPGQACASQLAAQRADAAEVVHPLSCITGFSNQSPSSFGFASPLPAFELNRETSRQRRGEKVDG
jgi:hypothetical protein